MPSVRPVDDVLTPDTENEIRIKKGISLLDAVLLSLGFTSSNLQHIVTPIAQGGLGASLTGLAGAIASVTILGVSTLIVTGVVSFFLFKLIHKSAEESLLLAEKENEWKSRQVLFFSRLIYIRHLLKLSTHPDLLHFQKLLKEHLELDDRVSARLAVSVDTIYREQKGFARVFLGRDRRSVSEEKAIQTFFYEQMPTYMLRIQESLYDMDIVHPAHKSNWKPELIGAFAGFISFISMSSGFLGAYSSVVTLAMSVSALSLAIPFLGWIFFGCSLLFALAIGFTVRHYTNKSMKRQEMVSDIEKQQSTLADGLAALHDLEMQLLTNRLESMEPRDAKETSRSHQLIRSRSWSGRFFVHTLWEEGKSEVKGAPEKVSADPIPYSHLRS